MPAMAVRYAHGQNLGAKLLSSFKTFQFSSILQSCFESKHFSDKQNNKYSSNELTNLIHTGYIPLIAEFHRLAVLILATVKICNMNNRIKTR